MNPVYDYDFGPDFNYNDESGLITKEPPAIRRIHLDAGTEGGCAMATTSEAYRRCCGRSRWARISAGIYRGGGFDKGKICTLNGGYLPFAKTKAERAGFRRSAAFARRALRHP